MVDGEVWWLGTIDERISQWPWMDGFLCRMHSEKLNVAKAIGMKVYHEILKHQIEKKYTGPCVRRGGVNFRPPQLSVYVR
jgi:hypothetical protein